MKLHFQIYQNGHIGMCNILMSIENGLILGKLLDREVIFYHGAKLFNSEKNLRIDDLFDFKNCSFVVGNPPDNIPAFHHDFHGTVITWLDDLPTPEFNNNRSKTIVLDDYLPYPEIRTKDSNTLAFYSYLFNIKGKKDLAWYLKECIQPKEKYHDEIDRLINKYSPFVSLNVRRGDYLYIKGMKNVSMTQDHYLSIVNYNWDFQTILIHTDEKDPSVFDKISNILIQNEISDEFDSAEKGLISMFIALASEDFIGTHYSTFSAMIQRWRLREGKNEEFKYLYSQEEGVRLDEYGRMIDNGYPAPTWGRVNQKQDIAFWTREYPEAIDN
jgi:hypothetical protein